MPALMRTWRSVHCAAVVVLSTAVVVVSTGTSQVPSDSERKRLWYLACLPIGGGLERCDGSRLVEVQDGVELIRQPCVEVVALALGVGSVDHADRPLQLRVAQGLPQREHQDVRAIGVRGELPGEQATGLPAITKRQLVHRPP